MNVFKKNQKLSVNTNDIDKWITYNCKGCNKKCNIIDNQYLLSYKTIEEIGIKRITLGNKNFNVELVDKCNLKD